MQERNLKKGVMNCDVYNGHPDYCVGQAKEIVQELATWLPIHYDTLSVAFLPEKTICELHQRFLGDPEPTDVITFPADESEVERTGEICISVDEALTYVPSQSLEEEVTLYLVHGWLHLAGYCDQKEEERRTMRQMEQKALRFLSTQPIRRLSVKRWKKK